MADGAQAALTRFAELLDDVCPRHRDRRQPLEIEADAPERMRAFWSTVEYSDAVGAVSVVGPVGPKPQPWQPTREASRHFIRHTFEDWFSEDAQARDDWGVEPHDFDAAWARLPLRFRVLKPDGRRPLIVDESGSDEDPALLEVQMATGELLAQEDRAVERLIRDTLARVFSSRRAGARDLPVRGEQMLAPVFPGLYQLADGVWGIDAAPRTPDSHQGSIVRIYFASFARYLDFLLGQPDEQISHFGSPSGEIFLLKDDPRLHPNTLVERGFRTFEGIRESPPRLHWKAAIGRLDGIDAWIHQDVERRDLTLIVAHQDFTATRDWLRRHKVRLEDRPAQDGPDIWAEPTTT